MSPSELPHYHPDYGVDGQQPTNTDGNTDRCECGGIRYWHATLIGGGCEDCPCPEFKAAQ